MKVSAFVLVGATATGKSQVALMLAQRLGVDIVSADSMNVYRGMDIGTSKPAIGDRDQIPHHGMDIRTPAQHCSVGIWRDCVFSSLRQRAGAQHDRPVIIAGGTGLYVRSLLFGLDDLPEISESVRDHWRSVAEGEHGLARLRDELKAKGPEWFASIKDSSNARRLQRALELIDCGMAQPPGAWGEDHRDESIRVTGLHVERDMLNDRIAQRAKEMFGEGLVDEAAGLRNAYPDMSRTAASAIGYREAFATARNDMSLADAIEATTIRTRRLAKRQRTWFRNQLSVDWITSGSESVEDTVNRIADLWESQGPMPLVIPTEADG